jgi:hypothetical protein
MTNIGNTYKKERNSNSKTKKKRKLKLLAVERDLVGCL